jgi:hypothetical protein
MASANPITTHTGGTWRAVKNKRMCEVITDAELATDDDRTTGHGDVEYYGGLLIAESVKPHNVDLISAAPDLYEALAMVRDADEDCGKDGLPRIPFCARAKIDAAIAKAEGRL